MHYHEIAQSIPHHSPCTWDLWQNVNWDITCPYRMSADEDILDILLNIYPEECFIAKAETLGLCTPTRCLVACQVASIKVWRCDPTTEWQGLPPATTSRGQRMEWTYLHSCHSFKWFSPREVTELINIHLRRWKARNHQVCDTLQSAPL